MYWIYLTIFVTIVLIPEIVRDGFYLLTEEQTEAVSIFLLGVSGFVVFLWLHDKFQKSYEEKRQIQQQATQTARDLSASYSYIGNVNRKVDILQSVILSLPRSAGSEVREDREVYKSILDAIQMIAKTDRFTLRFMDVANGTVKKEIFNNPDYSCAADNKKLCSSDMKNIFEEDGVTVFRSPYDEHNIRACIVVCKGMKRTHEDDEFMKALAAQAILLYLFREG